jgi:alcohol dehydrogenase class IV
MDSFVLRSAREIYFGSGQSHKTGELAALLGERALLVCGRGAPGRGSLIADLEASLEGAGVAVTLFAEAEAEPSTDTVAGGRAIFADEGCDLVVAVGGGSALDVGKAIGGLAQDAQPVSHFLAGAEIRSRGCPIVALPTTSGTGAEVTPNSVLTDPATGSKASIRGLALLPEVAIVDPELTVSLPPPQTAYSGLDALTQAIEAYTSRGANVVSDAYAEEAVRRIASSLRPACAAGDDREARSDMALGSLLAGLALASARLGLVHGLAHPLGVLYHIPHGQVCGLLLGPVMRFNAAEAEGKYARLAGLIGLKPTAAALLEWVEALVAELGGNQSFADLGLREEDFAQIIPPALASGSSKHNPRSVNADDLDELLRRLLS